MRPAQILLDSFLTSGTPLNPGLIGWQDLRYDRQELPMEQSPQSPNVDIADSVLMISRGFSSQESRMQPQPPLGDKPSRTQSNHSSQHETREEKLARIRAEIASGTYETPEKLEAAIDRMLGVVSAEHLD